MKRRTRKRKRPSGALAGRAGVLALCLLPFSGVLGGCQPADPIPQADEERSVDLHEPGGSELAGLPGAEDNGATGPELEPELRSRLDAALAGFPLVAGGERIHSTISLPRVYEARLFRPIWVGGSGLRDRGRTLVERLRDAEDDGLDPVHYHLTALDSLIPVLGSGSETDELRRRVDVDLLLTDAFLLFGSHLLHGRLDPVSMEPAWTATRNGVEMDRILLEALENGRIGETLDALRPDGERYPVLQELLRRYRRIAAEGGWPQVPAGETLDPGMRDSRVAALRGRLAVAERLDRATAEVEDPELYDEGLAEAVRRFQRDHGLEPDGRVGRGTLAALNVPARDRLDQMVVNLERWRWLPRELGDRYILVNIPGFSVSVVDDGEETMRLRAVVGRAYRQTPVFSGRMTYLALAPYWNVPPGIAANDQLPRIRENPGYVADQNMVLFDNATNRIVDPHSVSWTGMTGSEFNRRFRLRQEPGPNNALGSVKFMFPNRHNVYLHDTPARELFDRAARDFSSGCIRVDRPLELARHLLREDPSWTEERLRRVMRGGREQAVTLPRPYEVHLQYWTAWVEPDGRVQFREDIYNRDGRVREALLNPPPRAL